MVDFNSVPGNSDGKESITLVTGSEHENVFAVGMDDATTQFLSCTPLPVSASGTQFAVFSFFI
jgi:hypothetical protein